MTSKVKVETIESNAHQKCDKCGRYPLEGEEMKQVQTGIRIRFYCKNDWLANRAMLMRGEI